MLGANEISLNYDDTLKKLNFDALHFPFYVGATAPTQGGQPGCIYPQATTSGGTTLYLQPNPGAGEPGHNTPIPTIPKHLNIWRQSLRGKHSGIPAIPTIPTHFIGNRAQ